MNARGLWPYSREDFTSSSIDRSVSAIFGALLMIICWMVHMDWPFIENTNNLILDYHLANASVLLYLIVKQVDHVCGLDAWAGKAPLVMAHPELRPLIG